MLSATILPGFRGNVWDGGIHGTTHYGGKLLGLGTGGARDTHPTQFIDFILFTNFGGTSLTCQPSLPIAAKLVAS